MRATLIAVVLMLALCATAQEAEPEAETSKQATGPETSTTSNDSEATDRSQSTPYFEPSEEISEDLSVSFPVDI